MTDEITALVVSEPVYAAIRETIAETPEGVETGVTLFGVRGNGARVALFAVGPGPTAVHTPGYHEPDTYYVNREFDKLKESFPSLEWIGSLHAHPLGMTWLSGHDCRTVAKLLALHPERLHLPDFIAGIIQRRRGKFAVYPYLLEPNGSLPWLVPVQIVAEDADPVSAAIKAAKEPHPVGPHDTELHAAAEQKPARCRVSLLRAFFSYAPRIIRKTRKSTSNRKKGGMQNDDIRRS